MLTDRQRLAESLLPERVAAYESACRLLDASLKPSQRLSRQEHVRCCLRALNVVREAAGLPPQVAPRLLSLDEVLQYGELPYKVSGEAFQVVLPAPSYALAA